jgi:nucleoside-diphosphate-sugar epimerase
VTGATGFLGGALARQLIAAGHHVVALVRSPHKADALRAIGDGTDPGFGAALSDSTGPGPGPGRGPGGSPRLTIVQGDITDRASVRLAMAGAAPGPAPPADAATSASATSASAASVAASDTTIVDGVFHCAAWYKIGEADAAAAERTNVDGTRNVLEIMRELRVRKGVYTSTLAIFSDTHGEEKDESYVYDGPFLSVYERTKWRAHYEVALPLIRDGLPLVITQPGAIYGPDDTSGLRGFFRQYLQSQLLAVPAKTGFSWGYIDDVAHGHVLAMEQGRAGETYIVAGPSHTMAEALQFAEQITGIKAPGLRPSPTVMKAAAAVMRLVGGVAPLPKALAAETLRTLAGVTYFGSPDKARRELGYAPRPLIEGLRKTLEWETRLLQQHA